MRRTSCKIAAVCLAAVVLAGGCASSREDIPPGAQMVVEGEEKLTYQAPRSGTIYLYDDDANRLIYSGAIDRNETFSLDAKDDDIMIGSRRATEYDLDPDHRMQLYFEDEVEGPRRRDRADDDRRYERRYERERRDDR